jgi:exosortase A
MTAGAAIPAEMPRLGMALPWRRHLVGLVAAWVAILVLFWRDAAKIVTIWLESSTFNQCLLILPLIFWLAWQRQSELRRLAPRAWAPGLLLVGAGAGAWLLGDAGSLGLARHAGLVLMLQGAAIACLGKAVSRGLAFPIFYALFLIPVGEEAVPMMQTVTAEISMGLLALVGVPAHIEGVFISTPNGFFEVAEACSGVRFLVAMIALAALVANLCFRSWRRRILFLGAAILSPVLANGVRAWATIYVAYRSGSTEFADGFDHILYGWVFFAIVIALTLGAAWPFFDRKPGDPWFDPRRLQAEGSQAGSARLLVRIAAAAVAIAALPPLWSAAMASTAAPVPAEIAMPEVAGWHRVPATTGRPWAPNFAGADLVRIAHYNNQAGQSVDLAIIVFARQAEGRELIAFGQGAAAPGGAWAWTADDRAPAGGKAELIFSHGAIREVLSFYRIGSVLTGSAAAVKLETMKTKLLGGPQRAVAILVSAEAPADGTSARPALDSFLSALGPIAPLADRAAGLPEPR